GDTGARVMVDFNNEIIKMIVATEPVAGLAAAGHLDRPVITSARRVLAPRIVCSDSPDRQGGDRPGRAIGPPPQPQRMEGSSRGRAVAFPFVRPDATAAERHRKGMRPGGQPAANARSGRR